MKRIIVNILVIIYAIIAKAVLCFASYAKTFAAVKNYV